MTFEEFERKLKIYVRYRKHYNAWFDISCSSTCLESPEAFQQRANNIYVRKAKHEMKKLERKMSKDEYKNEDIHFVLAITNIIVDNLNKEHSPTFQILFLRYCHALSWQEIANMLNYADRSTVQDYAEEGRKELYKLYNERSNDNEKS